MTDLSSELKIVHFGPGRFFRAHQALVYQYLKDLKNLDLKVYCVALNSKKSIELLKDESDYMVYECDETGTNSFKVDIIEKIYFAPEAEEKILSLLSDDKTVIVSSTITEKAYMMKPDFSGLDKQMLDKEHPLFSGKNADYSIYNFLKKALVQRWQNQQEAFVFLCCDNLMSNGKLLKTMLLDFCSDEDPAFLSWLETKWPVPSTLVDRIVPADKPDTVLKIKEQDIVCEKFFQWVIEAKGFDKISWLSEGAVQFTSFIDPYEQVKLRLLNGAHSTIAYLGCLYGFSTIRQSLENDLVRNFVSSLLKEETIASLGNYSLHVDLNDYAELVFKRFLNPHIHHTCLQVSMDGSKKLPYRIISTIKVLKSNSFSYKRHLMVLFLWFFFAIDYHKKAYEIKDPLAEKLKEIAKLEKSLWFEEFLALPLFEDDFWQKSRTMKSRMANMFKKILESSIEQQVKNLSVISEA